MKNRKTTSQAEKNSKNEHEDFTGLLNMNREQKVWMGLFLVLLAFFFLYSIMDVLFPFLASFVVAYFINPWIQLIRKNRISKTIIQTIPTWFLSFTPFRDRELPEDISPFGGVVIFFITATFGLLLIIIPTTSFAFQEYREVQSQFLKTFEKRNELIDKASQALTPQKIQEHLKKLKIPAFLSPYVADIIPMLQKINISPGRVFQALQDFFITLKEYFFKISKMTYNFFLGTFSRTFGLLMIPVFVFFILKDYDEIIIGLHSFIPPIYRSDALTIIHEIDDRIQSIVKGQLISATIFATLMFLGLNFLGVKYAFFLGVGAGFANLIPYLGTVLISIPTLFVIFFNQGWFTSESFIMLAKATVLFTTVGLLDSKVIMPKLVGEKAGLIEVEVFFALAVGGSLLGLYGLIFAIPIAAIIKVLITRMRDYLYETSQIKHSVES